MFEALERLLLDEVATALRLVEVNAGEEIEDDDWYVIKLDVVIFEALERLLKSDEVVIILRLVEVNAGEEMEDDD